MRSAAAAMVVVVASFSFACALPDASVAKAPSEPATRPATMRTPAAQPYTDQAARGQALLRAQSDLDLAEQVAWTKRINLGDPHKYILPRVAARLHFDVNDAAALDAYRAMIASDKQKIENPKDRGIYHFASLPKARIVGAYYDRLPPDIRAWIDENEGGHLPMFRAGGTENHILMNRTSGYFFAERYQKPGEASDELAFHRDELRAQVKKLYTVGQGEWDSSTYVGFSVAGWCNVYDYAKDPAMRELARAALDWYAAAYGLKYFHGVHAGPEARGMANRPVSAITDYVAWLWFGDAPDGFTPDLAAHDARYAIIPALSGYKPPAEIVALAQKRLAPAKGATNSAKAIEPFAVRASKPVYYGTKPDNVYNEYLYFTDRLAMGSLYDSTPGDKITGEIWPQTTMFKLAVVVPPAEGKSGDVVVFTAGNGYHGHFPTEGRSPYDQWHQERAAAINLCRVIDPDTGARAAARSLLAVPVIAGNPERSDAGWLVWRVGAAWVGVRPIGEKPRVVDLADWTRRTQKPEKDGSFKTRQFKDFVFWQVDGTTTGWVFDTAPAEAYADAKTFAAALATKTRLDESKLGEGRLEYTSLAGDTLTLLHPGGRGGKAKVLTNGKDVDLSTQDVYASPWINLKLHSGVLSVRGPESVYTVDFSADRPVFRSTPVAK